MCLVVTGLVPEITGEALAIAFLPLVARLAPAVAVGFVPTILVIRRYPGPNSTGQAPLRLGQRALRANRGGLW